MVPYSFYIYIKSDCRVSYGTRLSPVFDAIPVEKTIGLAAVKNTPKAGIITFNFLDSVDQLVFTKPINVFKAFFASHFS
jgi:hypothetical protein